MAIDTTNKKLAVMVLNNRTRPRNITEPTGSFDQGDQQRFLWGYPGILWGAPPEPPDTLNFIGFRKNVGRTINTGRP